ncbi:hypothetical protein NLU13_9861 [Sarocladium strictum]|uniref:SP-RING-type domain-containing protein n=1 Tax=Sarocladium strictum TaxID=5046 RepID=A0AA39G8R4_SARSR|nr:hypothetical protein NLU13_9861 [Sarocladium strictum]
MPRRLASRSAPTHRSTSHHPTSTSSSLPPYQPPSCHHSASHRLTDIPSSRAAIASAALLKRHLQDVSRNLAHSADDLQARLRERRAKLAQIRRRREERETERTGEEEDLEEHVEKLEGQVRDLTEKSESAMRGVVDTQAAVEDEAQVLKDLEAEFSNRRPGEDPDAPPTETPLSVYKSLVSAKQASYTALTPHERYALNNEYATFKKLWHLGLVGEDGPPLPDASRWFDSRGRPVLSAAEGERGLESDEEDDIEVAREVVSLICPLTQSVMKEPWSNRRCKHTFEREAIQHHLRVSGEAQCPQTGCSQIFNFRDFKDDFFLDQTMLRRIERANEADRHRDDYDDSRFYDDEEDENLISDTSGLPAAKDEEDEPLPRGARSVSRVPKRERMSMGRN